MVTKVEWRRRLREQRLASDKRELWMKAFEPWLATINVPVLGLYWPLPGEFDLLDMARSWAKAHGTFLALPAATSPGIMTYRLWEEGRALGKDTAGIPAPVDAPEVLPDFLLVPGLGFSESGHRLGYGGGYFDRYLAVRGVEAWLLMLESQRVPESLFEDHDVRFTGIVTECGPRSFTYEKAPY